jgi:4-hydroxyphenylpyruvate dioxygenase
MQIDHIHFYVEDAVYWRNWCCQNLGFCSLASYSYQHSQTEIIARGRVCFWFSAPRLSVGPVAVFLRSHPPGVVDVAVVVADVQATVKRAIALGSQPIQPSLGPYPSTAPCILAWGTLRHTILERPLYSLEADPSFSLDHLVLNVPAGQLGQAVDWYQWVFDLIPQQKFTISTDYSGLFSQVMGGAGVQLPINQPTSPSSQIQEFLDHNHGAGIQHLALRVDNLTSLVARLRRRGVAFLPTVAGYYDRFYQGVVKGITDLDAIAEQGILIDCPTNQPGAILLQIFTQPIFSQPTFFWEFIERRRGARGFGEGNFQSLFNAMEAEQRQRQPSQPGNFLANDPSSS